MYHFIIHCKPNPSNEEYFGKVLGAYAMILINYKDYKDSVELAKYYVQENNWEIIEWEDEYYEYNKKNDLDKDYQKYYDEVMKYGYSMIFNLYENEE